MLRKIISGQYRKYAPLYTYIEWEFGKQALAMYLLLPTLSPMPLPDPPWGVSLFKG